MRNNKWNNKTQISEAPDQTPSYTPQLGPGDFYMNGEVWTTNPLWLRWKNNNNYPGEREPLQFIKKDICQ